jgi:hypothetical protein
MAHRHVVLTIPRLLRPLLRRRRELLGELARAGAPREICFSGSSGSPRAGAGRRWKASAPRPCFVYS